MTQIVKWVLVLGLHCWRQSNPLEATPVVLHTSFATVASMLAWAHQKRWTDLHLPQHRCAYRRPAPQPEFRRQSPLVLHVSSSSSFGLPIGLIHGAARPGGQTNASRKTHGRPLPWPLFRIGSFCAALVLHPCARHEEKNQQHLTRYLPASKPPKFNVHRGFLLAHHH